MEQIINNNQPFSFEQLSLQIIRIDEHTRQSAIKAINQMATLRNWLIGAYIVEYEQNGSDRAQYGERIIERLAKKITRKKIKSDFAKKLQIILLAIQSV